MDARTRAELDRAASLYRSFSGHAGEPLQWVSAPRVPRVAMLIGYCDGLLYSAVRDGELEPYIHKFARRDRPLFLVSPDGKQIILYGGNFRFTSRGIVDRSHKGG